MSGGGAECERETLAFISDIRTQVDVRIRALERARVDHGLNTRSLSKLYSLQSLFNNARWEDYTLADTTDALVGGMVRKGWVEHIADCDSEIDCAICGEEVREGEAVSRIHCKHSFHTECINRHLGNLIRARDIPQEMNSSDTSTWVSSCKKLGEELVLCPLCRCTKASLLC